MMTIPPDVFIVVLGLLGLLASLLLWRAQVMEDEFDLRHMLVDTATGRVSLFKFGQLTALATSTWIVIYESLNGRMTDWLFTGFVLTWSGANVANKFVEQQKKPENS